MKKIIKSLVFVVLFICITVCSVIHSVNVSAASVMPFSDLYCYKISIQEKVYSLSKTEIPNDEAKIRLGDEANNFIKYYFSEKSNVIYITKNVIEVHLYEKIITTESGIITSCCEDGYLEYYSLYPNENLPSGEASRFRVGVDNKSYFTTTNTISLCCNNFDLFEISFQLEVKNNTGEIMIAYMTAYFYNTKSFSRLATDQSIFTGTSFGAVTVASNGCGAIAVHNAKLLNNQSSDLFDVANTIEENNYFTNSGQGALGTSSDKIKTLMGNNVQRYGCTSDSKVLLAYIGIQKPNKTKFVNAINSASVGTVGIILVNTQGSLHYYAFKKTTNGLVTYNQVYGEVLTYMNPKNMIACKPEDGSMNEYANEEFLSGWIYTN